MNSLSKRQSEQTAEVQTVPEASEATQSRPEGNNPKTAKKSKNGGYKNALRSNFKTTSHSTTASSKIRKKRSSKVS